MMYYAMYDFMTYKGNPGRGFANTKSGIAFKTRAERDAFLAEKGNYDFTAKAITRAEAMTMLEAVYDSRGDKGLRLGSEDGPFVVMRSTTLGKYNAGDIV